MDMRVHDVTRYTIDSFRQRSFGRKIVLLYPWANYRNMFLSHFLSSAKDGLLYYRIATGQTTLTSWLKGMTAEFKGVLNHFGTRLEKALEDPTPAALGKALAGDLAAYSKEQVVVFVDELDRIPLDSEFEAFIAALVKALPDHVQMAFSSRLLTHQPWYDMVVRGEAIVMGTELRRNDLMFTIENRPKPQLEVYALGRGYALVNGQMITNWDGGLPRNLFFFFMDQPLVTRDEIFKTFWPSLPVREATNVFHVTKRKITERISMKVEEPGSYELTQYSSGFYMPGDKIIRHYDVADFEDAVDRASETGNEREELALLTRAVELYKAPFLQQVDMEWVKVRRAELREKYSQALISLGRLHKQRGDDQKALGLFNRALKETPTREDIHRETMAIYAQLGMPSDARAQYNRLTQILAESSGLTPARETRELIAQIESSY
jgi:DNA-binding SARP family transcriptional activator